MPTLEITEAGKTRAVRLDKPATSIGREKSTDVPIGDSMASRQHCVVERRGAEFVVRDLSSRNGTWVGENRIEEAYLEHGDVFRIGKTEFRLVFDTAAPPPKPKPAPLHVAAPPPSLSAPTTRTAGAAADDVDEVIIEIPSGGSGEIAIPNPDAMKAPTSLATRNASIGVGPLSRQLAPLVQAVTVQAGVRGMPNAPADVRLLDRQSKPLKVDPTSTNRSHEALFALQQMLFAAFRSRSTDIHLEPKEAAFGLRFRIDGMLHPVGEVAKPLGMALLNVIKVLCAADIAKRNVVQEGSFASELADRRVDFRVSLSPTLQGQKLALRILDKNTVPSRFEDLGMDLEMVSEIRRITGQDAGMIIVSGPTGSGKTTTLYTALKTINAKTRNVVTIEDPVEYKIEHTTQISIDPTHNVTFSSVLATVLRQDPDVILVGEIRDRDTADMAMQAATTGHLVLSTVHARDTIGTVFRLIDLGVETFQIANALTLAVSQRLVRVLCPHCKRPWQPDARRIREMRLEERHLAGAHMFTFVGCNRCMNTGYSGRMAIYEMLTFTPALKDVILTRPTIGDIRKAAGDWMFRTLADSGYSKVLAGLTTVEEVDRVASAD